jgi:hypothetical protein
MPSHFTWKAAPDLMARLTAAQNHPANLSQDIVTFAGFCESRAELEAHVARYEEYAARWVAPKRGRRAA